MYRCIGFSNGSGENYFLQLPTLIVPGLAQFEFNINLSGIIRKLCFSPSCPLDTSVVNYYGHYSSVIFKKFKTKLMLEMNFCSIPVEFYLNSF